MCVSLQLPSPEVTLPFPAKGETGELQGPSSPWLEELLRKAPEYFPGLHLGKEKGGAFRQQPEHVQMEAVFGVGGMTLPGIGYAGIPQ